MAWFNEAANAAAACLPVTLDRIEKTLQSHNFTYDREDEAIYSGFDGYPVVFLLTGDDEILMMSMVAPSFRLPAERTGEVIKWAMKNNYESFLGVFYAIPAEDDDGTDVRLDIAYPVAAGLNDDQLDLYLSFAIQAGVEIMENFAKDFSLTSPSEEGLH